MAIPQITVRHPGPTTSSTTRSRSPASGPASRARSRRACATPPATRSRRSTSRPAAPGIWGNFFFRIDVPGVPNRPRGTLEVFEFSAKDGSEINKRVIPIVYGRALVDPYTGFMLHTVAAGDTLSKLADTFLGDPSKFQVIFAANRDQLDDPDVIVVGQVLRIPQ